MNYEQEQKLSQIIEQNKTRAIPKRKLIQYPVVRSTHLYNTLKTLADIENCTDQTLMRVFNRIVEEEFLEIAYGCMAGGLDHIDEYANGFIFYDRCCQCGGYTDDRSFILLNEDE